MMDRVELAGVTGIIRKKGFHLFNPKNYFTKVINDELIKEVKGTKLNSGKELKTQQTKGNDTQGQ